MAPAPRFALPFLLLALVAPAIAQTSLPPGTQAPPSPAQQGASPLNAVENDIANGQCTKAESLLNAYLSAHATDDRALFDMGYCEDAAGHTVQAAAYFRKALAANPHQFESHLALGLLLAGQGKPEAQTQLEAATADKPNPPNPTAKAQAWRALAKLLAKSDPTKASTDLVQALKLTPETTSDTLLAARIAENAGSPDIAEQEYRHVLANAPENSAAIAGLTHILMLEKKYDQAEPLVKSALVRDPDDPTLNAEYAAILSAEGKLTQAIASLEKLHQLHPNNPTVANMLADAYLQSGDMDKAAALYPQVIAAQPGNTDALDSYGQVLIRQKKYAEAIASFQQALKTQPSDIDALSGVAFASNETHQYQQEIAALQQRAQLTPNTPATLFLFATAYDHLRQYKQAADYYHQFLASNPGPRFANQIWQAKHRLIALPRH
jgi:tetratricopeptide (TPR) repeat protein